MPVVHFTFHAYGSWMPDRAEGFVRRGEGVLPPNDDTADWYRTQMSADAVTWTAAQQRVVLEALLEKCAVRGWTLHAGATERTHVHVVVSWDDDVEARSVRQALKEGVSRRLGERFGRRSWLAEGGSMKRIKDAEHLQHLRAVYLPSHGGWRYDGAEGWVEPRR